MMWPIVIQEILAVIAADDDLGGLFGTAVYRAGDRDFQVPALEWTLISDTETEVWNPLRIQFDVFVRTDDHLVLAERALRRLFHRDLPVRFGDLNVFTQFQGRTNQPGLPDNIRGSSTDFLITPVRTRFYSEA